MTINELLVAIQKQVRDRDDKIIELREIIRKLESRAKVASGRDDKIEEVK